MSIVVQALGKVLRRPLYAILAAIVGLLVFMFATWLPNLGLVADIFRSHATLAQKIQIPFSLLGSIATNFSLLSASYVIGIAVFFGLNVALAVFTLRRRAMNVPHGGIATSVLGIVSGYFGIGCAACGSFLFTTILAWFGAASAIALLPLAGAEFGLLGLALLVLSLYLTARQIENPAVCKV
ncbi:MAG: hypothetical protein NUV42_00810 [Candidatus Yonathbacteria bacterium]|nr:hypothetical protein [Candidatus Yonathbacteria bacterium]